MFLISSVKSIFLVYLTLRVSSAQFRNIINSLLNIIEPHPTAPLYLSDAQVLQYLTWDSLLPAIESAMVGVIGDKVLQPARLFMKVPGDGMLLDMPGYVKSNQPNVSDSMAVKIATSYNKNKNIGLPTIQAVILLYNTNNGQLEAIMEATEITKWRTAAASVVATKHMFRRSGQKGLILAIMGSGAEAYIHAKAFAANFDLKKIIIWNYRPMGAVALVRKLQAEGIAYVEAEDSGATAVQNADIVVTATFSSVPVVHYAWLRKGDVHVNSIGAGDNHHSELDKEIYSNANVYFNTEEAAKDELKELYEAFPNNMRGQVGEFIAGKVHGNANYNVTVYMGFGMACEDVVAAQIVYDAYMKANSR